MTRTQIWTPPNIAPICAETHAHLTQCGNIGYLYLSLLAQLFGSSLDSVHKDHFMDYRGEQSSHEDNIEFGRHLLKHYKEHDEKHNRHDERYKRSYTLGPIKVPIGIVSNSYEDDAPPKILLKKPLKEEKKEQVIKEDNEYDFIIVGAGSSGCVVANRLSENKHWKVLLLEAGPEEVKLSSVPGLATSLQNSNVDWAYRTQPEKRSCRALRDQACVWTRGRQMGGSSTVNFMIYMRGNRRDYDSWAEQGNHGWSYNEVLPYFKKSENNQDIESHDRYYHATGGPLNVERFPYVDENSVMIVKGFHEQGLPLTDFNAANQIGTNIAQSMSLHGQRLSNNAAFIRPIRNKRKNLIIKNTAFVTKVLIDPKTKTAYGVEYIKNRQVHHAIAKKEVIVSTGTLNSPKLLMLSGVGPKEQLESFHIPVLADLDVGYNLQDQVSTDGIVIGLSNKTSTWLDDKELLHAIEDYHKQPEKKEGPLSVAGTIIATAFMKTKYATEDAPDIQFHFEARKVKDFYADTTNYLATKVLPLSFYDGLSARPLLLTPKSRGVVKLNTTDPIFGMPMIYSGFFTKEGDIDVILEGIKFVLGLEKTAIFKHNGARFVRKPVEGCRRFRWGTEDYFKCLLVKYTATLYHPVGTCKMGPKSDKTAVVDPRLRVYGIKHLRVIDSSIIPKVVRANTNAPTTMVGEKGADMIKEDWHHYEHGN